MTKVILNENPDGTISLNVQGGLNFSSGDIVVDHGGVSSTLGHGLRSFGAAGSTLFENLLVKQTATELETLHNLRLQTLLAQGSSIKIENILIGSVVLADDTTGTPVPGRATKLFRNTTSEFIRLSFDDREDLVATPGHRFLTETGDYLEIGHMLRLGGGTARVVGSSGAMSTDTGEPLALEDWRSGASLVVVDVVSPFAEAEGVRERFLCTARLNGSTKRHSKQDTNEAV